MRAMHSRGRCMLARATLRRRAQLNFHFATQRAMTLLRQHKHGMFIKRARKQPALDHLKDVIHQRLLVIIFQRSVGGKRRMPTARNLLRVRSARNIGHIRGAVALTSAHHRAQQFARHRGGIICHAHFLQAHIARAATICVASCVSSAAVTRKRLVTLTKMLNKPSMTTRRATSHALHRFKLHAALRHRRIKRRQRIGVGALVVQTRARLISAALRDGIPLHHIGV